MEWLEEPEVEVTESLAEIGLDPVGHGDTLEHFMQGNGIIRMDFRKLTYSYTNGFVEG